MTTNLVRTLLLTTAFVLSGCSARTLQILNSTSPLPDGVRGTVPAYGSDCQYYLLGLIPVSFSPSTQAALTKAKASAHADVLTDVTIDEGGAWYILFSNTCIRVQGMGVPKRLTSSPHANHDLDPFASGGNTAGYLDLPDDQRTGAPRFPGR